MALAAQVIAKLFKEATILAPQFSNDLSTVAQIEQNVAEAKKYMHEFRPDVVIGSSFGGFISTFLNGYPRILINPCLRPSERLHNLSPKMSKEDIEQLKVLETSQEIDGEMRFEMYGLFGLNDELFSYLDLFKKQYGESKTYTMSCGHRIDVENIKNHLIPIIWEVNKISESLTPEMFEDYCPDDI
jgi:predicted esterase YcpF (UPF0227 family)